MLRNLPLIGLALMIPLKVSAVPDQEMQEGKFLDLVEVPGNVPVTAVGVEAVNAEARRQGLRLPALGYWSPDKVCFSSPPAGECNGIFKR